MREHEVPTHVGAEDRVLLGFTFPQIVAMTAVCALAYGVHRHAPIGADGVRTALAVVCALVGLALAGGRIGGGGCRRRSPTCRARGSHAGPPSELAPPRARCGHALSGRCCWRAAPAGACGGGPAGGGAAGGCPSGPTAGSASAVGAGTRRDPVPARPGPAGPDRARGARSSGSRSWVRRPAAVGPAVLAGDRRRDAIGFEAPEPVPGRPRRRAPRQGAADRAVVSVRAAADLEVRVRAFGGPDGRALPRTMGFAGSYRRSSFRLDE